MIKWLSMLRIHIKISHAIGPRRADGITRLYMAPGLSRLLNVRIGGFGKGAILVKGLARVKHGSTLGFLVGGFGRRLRVFDQIPTVVATAAGDGADLEVRTGWRVVLHAWLR